MNLGRSLLLGGTIVAVAFLAVFVASNNQEVLASTFAQTAPPTPAPKPTPGPPRAITPEPIPMLAQPLQTEEQVLRQTLQFDASLAKWSSAWSLDTPRLEPGRVSVKFYPTGTYDPSITPDEGPGPVWVVSIKGDVRLAVPGVGVAPNATYDGVTYVVSQRTGHLLRVASGKQKSPPAAAQATATQAPIRAPGTLVAPNCTQNPSGLTLRVSQQPGQPMSPPGLGPMRSFYVEGKGFVPGEKVTVVMKGRPVVAGNQGSTTETVLADSTFATTVVSVVSPGKMPLDVFVVHSRGVACVTVTAQQ